MDDARQRRCPWCGDDPHYVAYHDREWGIPERSEAKMFESLVLESAQSGLAWITILRKREGYRAAFDGFDVDKIAAYDEADVERLAADARIVRHRGKIEATVANAKAARALREAGRSISELAWARVGGAPKVSHFERVEQIPSATPESTDFARELKSLGFRRFGPVTAQSHMQALGLFDDHLVWCRSRLARS